LFSVPFAQFFKTDLDFRVNMHLKGASRLIWRINAGIGIPFKNLGVLPYEQSFFCGGPNSVRAWRSRTLGPGAYNPGSNTMRFDKIGDILIETNLEYRFHLLRAFYGALFVDAGNIWRLYPDANKPEGVFNLNTFYKQIAVGSGFGFRWDLDFFVLRLDLAVPLKDPKNWKDENTWLFSQKPLKYIITNFGIGYPF
jgi:outer membrane protein assembly factor BamA